MNGQYADILEDGHLASFYPHKSTNMNGESKRQKISGSTNTYNLLYGTIRRVLLFPTTK
jgi:hypothetical protein